MEKEEILRGPIWLAKSMQVLWHISAIGRVALWAHFCDWSRGRCGVIGFISFPFFVLDYFLFTLSGHATDVCSLLSFRKVERVTGIGPINWSKLDAVKGFWAINFHCLFHNVQPIHCILFLICLLPLNKLWLSIDLFLCFLKIYRKTRSKKDEKGERLC